MRKGAVRIVMLAIGLLVFGLTSSRASAQTLGTFQWQLQPYCNVVSVIVTQVGGTYTLDGYDDQCGAGQRAPLTGAATVNPDGTIGIGLNIVTVPGGSSVHVDGRINLTTLGGSWNDSVGGTGSFVFNGNAPGTPRPLPFRVTQYVFPAHDFSTVSGVTLDVPIASEDVMNQSSWSVVVVRPGGNVYPLPGLAVDADSTYRVYWLYLSSGFARFVISLHSGTGEEYANIRILRTPAVTVSMP